MSTSGEVITNHHLVDRCREISIRRDGDVFRSAMLSAADRANDLALLKFNAEIGERDIASIRVTPPVRRGEVVAAYGFPMIGTLSAILFVNRLRPTAWMSGCLTESHIRDPTEASRTDLQKESSR